MMLYFHINKKLFSKHNLNQIAKRYLNALLCCVHSIFGIQIHHSTTFLYWFAVLLMINMLQLLKILRNKCDSIMQTQVIRINGV